VPARDETVAVDVGNDPAATARIGDRALDMVLFARRW
jgi:hypothetical protein